MAHIPDLAASPARKIDFKILVLFGSFAFCILFFLELFAGTKGLSFADSARTFFAQISGENTAASARIILLKVRLPRAFAAILCGSALSVSGLILQLSLNNSLAGPGIIGVNGGAGLFVLLFSLFFPYVALVRSLAAFFGAILAVLTVYFISRQAGVSKTTLVLSGVAVSSMMTAGIDVIITLKPEIVADKVAFSLGGFQNLNLSSLYIAFPVILLSLAGGLLLSSGIDLFQLGDETAFGLGLNVKRCRLLGIIISGLLAGASVSVCGLLGFVGLLIPNLIRLFSKNDTKRNIILSSLLGADFLLLCDLLARILFFPYELPVGLFLSCFGSPFFIWMLISKKKRLSV